MCNRIRPANRSQLRRKFGNIILTNGSKRIALDDLSEDPEVLFAYDIEKPMLPVMTSLNPSGWHYMRMGYLPGEAAGRPDLQEKLGNLYNARAETILEKFAFRNSIRNRRCIIPIDGFYDFQGRGKVGSKEDNQCYYISLKNGELFYAAGVWDICDGQAGFAIITTDANPLMSEIHNKNPRQPHQIDEQDWTRWLGPLADNEISAMLGVYPDDNMQAHEYDLPKPPPKTPKKPNGPPTLF